VDDHAAVYVVPLGEADASTREAAARLLVEEFREHWPEAWPTLASAEAEVALALAPEKVALAAVTPEGGLLGWIGGQPMYDGAVWELHPLVVARAAQGRGVGRRLVAALEKELSTRGALTLWLGTDDCAELTSLGGVDLYPDVVAKLATVDSRKDHPFGFYRALGFSLAGVVPDANGWGKPDILMAKRIAPAPSE
jgi:aminoglycoside 6'-N-acetyltransferase I